MMFKQKNFQKGKIHCYIHVYPMILRAIIRRSSAAVVLLRSKNMSFLFVGNVCMFYKWSYLWLINNAEVQNPMKLILCPRSNSCSYLMLESIIQLSSCSSFSEHALKQLLWLSPSQRSFSSILFVGFETTLSLGFLTLLNNGPAWKRIFTNFTQIKTSYENQLDHHFLRLAFQDLKKVPKIYP